MQSAIIKTNGKWFLEIVDNLKDLCNRPMTLSVDELIRFVPEYEYERKLSSMSEKVKDFLKHRDNPLYYMENGEVIYYTDITWCSEHIYQFMLTRDLRRDVTDSLTCSIYRPVFHSVYDMTPIGVVLEERF